MMPVAKKLKMEQQPIDLSDLSKFSSLVFVCPAMDCNFMTQDDKLFKAHVVENHNYVNAGKNKSYLIRTVNRFRNSTLCINKLYFKQIYFSFFRFCNAAVE